MPTGVDGANRAAVQDLRRSFCVVERQMEGTGDVIPGAGGNDGQDSFRPGAEVDPKVDRAVPAGDCQHVQP